MKLCWLLGVLTIALCKGEVSQNSNGKVTRLDTNRTTIQSENLPESNRTLTKRQTTQNDEFNQENTGADFKWNPLKNMYWRPQQKRGKFSSWAGKRNQDDSYENKRAKFSSWAGKRSPDRNLYLSDNTKRVKFSPWAGKRNIPLDFEDKLQPLAEILAGFSQEQLDEDNISDKIKTEKRERFSNWGGKRDSSIENKRKFSSWSGKRNDVTQPLQDTYSNINSQFSLTDRLNYPSEDNNEKRLQGFTELNGIKELDWDNNINDHLDLSKTAKSVDGVIQPDYWYKDLADKRGKFSSWGGKRKFSSWGGKRITDLDNEEMFNEGLDTEKRGKFSSWAGKRDNSPYWKSSVSPQGKRGKFSSWAGKRNDELFRISFEPDKRNAFSNWGGKRDLNLLDTHNDKIAKFSSWAGKRMDNDDEDTFNIDKRDTDWIGLKKKIKGRGFSSWGGKRSFLYDDNDDDLMSTTDYVNTDNNMDMFDLDKRATKFSSWAGKRSKEGGDKRKFSSWGGKRNYFDQVEDPKRATFSSWAGKRSVNPNDGPNMDKRKENLKSGLLRRYNRFNSWRGKKDNISPANDTQIKLEDVDFNQSRDNTTGNKFKRAFNNYMKQFEMIKRNPFLRAWIGKHYPDMMTWKRRPAFSSWGGKRSLNPEVFEELHQFDKDVEEDKRGKFSNWGGKRDHIVKKRSIQTSTEQFMQKPIINKKSIIRTVSSLVAKDTLDAQRYYLRNAKDGIVVPAVRPMRRQFYAWGGKRASKS